jgi:large subunit ribosomal protein L3
MGLMGRKLGMTRVYSDDGTAVPVTAVEMGPCTVVRKRTAEKHGYNALQLGFGNKRKNLFNKPELGAWDKVGKEPMRKLKEFRIEQTEADGYQEGQVITCEMFQAGQLVDVCATSKGRGFAGVIKMHHMHGFPRTHGTHEYQRHGGSVGCRAKPGRVHRGKRMPGHMGDVRVTNQNIEIFKVIAEDNLVLLKGSVPGPTNGMLEMRPAVKSKRKSSKHSA